MTIELNKATKLQILRDEITRIQQIAYSRELRGRAWHRIGNITEEKAIALELEACEQHLAFFLEELNMLNEGE